MNVSAFVRFLCGIPVGIGFIVLMHYARLLPGWVTAMIILQAIWFGWIGATGALPGLRSKRDNCTASNGS